MIQVYLTTLCEPKAATFFTGRFIKFFHHERFQLNPNERRHTLYVWLDKLKFVRLRKDH